MHRTERTLRRFWFASARNPRYSLRPSGLYFGTCLVLLALAACGPKDTLNRIRFHEQDLFLNGLNLAWGSVPSKDVCFANDIGPDPRTPDLAHFAAVFGRMQASGANSMRMWLHTNGAHTPAFEGTLVTGPGKHSIEDLRAVLDLAWEHRIGLVLCLWSFDMLRISNGPAVTNRAMALLTDETSRRSYIGNSLEPMVTALRGHPAIIAWEIFNEPEGMSVEHGWDFNHHVSMSVIQAFINQCAGAIHRADPGALVTNGSWAFIAASDTGEGNFNYYTDARLVAAGGDADGTLDFYTVHFYDWAGESHSPFHFPASHWGLDKPLVVAEFYPDCELCGPHAHRTLFENGYAGALGWSWTDRDPQILLEQIADVSQAHPEEILIK